MKQILCVIDFNQAAGNVLETAARIANSCRAHLIVLFPYRLIGHSHSGAMTSLRAKLESEAKEQFQCLRKTLPEVENSSCEFYAEIGFMTDRISAHLAKNDIDMVIIGQQQANAGNDKNGSNLQKLITTSEIPFVIVPTKVNAEATIYSIQKTQL